MKHLSRGLPVSFIHSQVWVKTMWTPLAAEKQNRIKHNHQTRRSYCVSNVLCLAAIHKLFFIFCWLKWQARRNLQNWAKSFQEPLPHQSSSLGFSILGDVSHSNRHPGHTACGPRGWPGPVASTCLERDTEQNPVSHILSISAGSDPLPKHCALENGHFSPL